MVPVDLMFEFSFTLEGSETSFRFWIGPLSKQSPYLTSNSQIKNNAVQFLREETKKMHIAHFIK